MVEIKVKRVNEDEVECHAAIDGTGEDIVMKSFYAIKGIFNALGSENRGLKMALVGALVHNHEWLDDDTREETLDDILGRKAKERSFN